MPKVSVVIASYQHAPYVRHDWYANVTLAKETMNWRSSIEFKHGLKLTRDWEMAAQKELKATKNFY